MELFSWWPFGRKPDFETDNVIANTLQIGRSREKAVLKKPDLSKADERLKIADEATGMLWADTRVLLDEGANTMGEDGKAIEVKADLIPDRELHRNFDRPPKS